ncbi:ABC-three component system middle component 6 [Pseudoalteromonas sp. 120-MNA-CIBAN-0494]|uniref:ABC-three component system middle component 6 n=1 Tax=unclassified Pseudoalteromonas TaxID=194690 RepID=UPI00333166DC
MITIDSDPMLNPIYIGASILNELSSIDFTEIGIEELYSAIKDKLDMSYEVFTFSLDWLYIIGALDLNENGFLVYAT